MLPETTKPTTIESVKFRDGMIVTADDLDAAMRYPASLLHTVLRAYFGCGVVCGLGLRVKKRSDGKPRWVLCVDRGVAIDCHGQPIELCVPGRARPQPGRRAPARTPPPEVCVAVRRITSDEAPHDGCTCDVDDPRFDCRRVRDHVVVKAFTRTELEALPGTVCQRPKPAKPAAGPGAENPPNGGEESLSGDGKSWKTLCEALTACSSCTCGACWILLGSVTLNAEKGIVGGPEFGERQWVKPIEVLCAGLDRIGELADTVAGLSKLTDRVGALEKRKDPEAALSKLTERVAALEKQSGTQGQ